MGRPKYDTDIRPVSEFRANAAELIDQVRESGRPLILTQRGHSAAVVLDVAALRSAPIVLRRVALWRAMTAAAGGRTISFDHVAAVLRLMDADGGRIARRPQG